MKVTIAPASTQTAQAVIRSLLQRHSGAQPIEIQAVYRDLAKVPQEFDSQKNFSAVKGDIDDGSSLNFSGAQAVFTMTPPVFDGRDPIAHAEVVSTNVRNAVERAGSVQRLVLLSSMGAQFSEGVGEIKTNNAAERALSPTKVPSVTIVRCAYFMENWTMFLGTLKGSEPFIYSTITPLDWKVAMVAVRDIGHNIADNLIRETQPATSPYTYELHGPQAYSPLDVHAVFTDVLGPTIAMKPVEKHELHGFYSKLFPLQIVDDWVEMALCFLPEGIAEAEISGGGAGGTAVVRGKTGLFEAIKEALAAAGLSRPE